MVGAEKQTDILCGGSCISSISVPSSEVPNANGIGVDVVVGSSGSMGSLVTYKRRKSFKVVLDDTLTESQNKSMNHLLGQDNQKKLHVPPIDSVDFSLKRQRNIVLQQICQSLEREGGLKKCIQSALALDPGGCSGTTLKDSICSCKNGSKSTFQSGSAHDGFGIENSASVGVTSGSSVSKPNRDTITELCQSAFLGIITSEKFADLCCLILENFQGMKADKLFDLNLINSRMEEGAYEGSPMLFYSDIHQMWTELEKVGSGILSLVKCLTNRSMTSFHEKVGNAAHNISGNGKHEFNNQESSMHAKPVLREACPLNEVHVCQRCGEKIDRRNGLVCDSCEEMYHISCIEPAVKEIPMRSWYCSNCSEKGIEIESSHENCVACERLNTSISILDRNEDGFLYKEELEESSNELATNEGSKGFPHCTVCRTDVKNDEDYRICGHTFCPHNFYHVRCLTSKELISYGPCWYCPSCLCRGCLADRDDDKIVLCDGCDHAYHIYCMHPSRTSIPRGKWFCAECDAGIQRLRKAKELFENKRNKYKKRGSDGKLKSEESSDKSGGVDMLLNAAKTLNYEENMSAMGCKSE